VTVFASTLLSSPDDPFFVSQIARIKTAIGNTPLAHIETLNGTRIYAKLEYYNPFSHSIKDRTAAYMLTSPLERGEITPSNDTIWIEASSGNLGIAYGTIGSLLGLHTKIVTSSLVADLTFNRILEHSPLSERTPGGYCPRGERDGALKKVMDTWLRDADTYIWRDQYSTDDNLQAHKETTGPEIWTQTQGTVTTLVVATGTGGTLIGTGMYLTTQHPDIELIGVQPQLQHHVHGLRNYQESMKPLLLQDHEHLIDAWMEVDDRETFQATQHLWTKGYPVGTSSGLNYAAARILAKERTNRVITTIFPDTWLNSFKLMQTYLVSGQIEPR
jgi:cysteine synthase B